MSSLILAALKFLPVAIDYGVPLAQQLIEHVNASVQPKSAVEEYASKILQIMPAMLAGGVASASVVEVLRHTNDAVATMVREQRGPNAADRAEQDHRIKALEDRLDAAAKRP